MYSDTLVWVHLRKHKFENGHDFLVESLEPSFFYVKDSCGTKELHSELLFVEKHINASNAIHTPGLLLT